MTLLIISVIFTLGSFVQTVAGFGSALVIMPLLTLYTGAETASTVLAIVGSAVVVSVLFQNRQGLRWGEAGRLLAGAVVGIPVGTAALAYLPGGIVVSALGCLLLAYGAYGFWSGRRSPATGDAPAEPASNWVISMLVGFCAGFLGGAYSTDGPPLVIYGSAKGWPKESFRSILQACFLVDGFLIIACHGAGGMMSRDVLTYSLYGLPGMLAGLLLGSWLDRRINHAVFNRLLLIAIVALGAGLVARGLMAR